MTHQADLSRTIVPFPGHVHGHMAWQALCLGNAAAQATESLKNINAGMQDLFDLALIEIKMKNDAMELSSILNDLAESINDLRQKYC